MLSSIKLNTLVLMKVSNSALCESAATHFAGKQTMIVVVPTLFFNLSFFKTKFSVLSYNSFIIWQFDGSAAFPAENQTLNRFKMFRVQRAQIAAHRFQPGSDWTISLWLGQFSKVFQIYFGFSFCFIHSELSFPARRTKNFNQRRDNVNSARRA